MKRFTRGNPVSSENTTRPGFGVDTIVVWLIAGTQLLAATLGGLMILFASMYGGGAVWPSRFYGSILFAFFGFSTAIFLFTRYVVARVVALLWHAALFAFVVSVFEKAPSSSTPLLTFWSGACACYLAATSIPKVWEAAKAEPREASFITATIATIITAVVCFQIFFNDTVSGLESQLHSTNSDSRCVAARRLGLKGAEAKSALPALKTMLDTTLCSDFGEFADNPASDIEKIGGIDPLIEEMREGKDIGRIAAVIRLKLVAAGYPDRAT